MRAITIASALLAATPATAASLLTDGTGYAGPILDLSAYSGQFVLSTGPIVLPNGITYSSNSNSSFLGSVTYGLVQNGTTNLVPIIATNQSDAAITLTFATPVALFGTGFNYGVLDGEPFGSTMPFISAFDVFGGLIASYNLHELAPIFTPGGVDQFRFRGIDGGGIGIKSFTLSGAGIAAAGNVTTQGAVPEPGSWAMLIAGFGLVGATMRRRRALLA